jgi:heme O synthase-like polyprenyltransferase
MNLKKDINSPKAFLVISVCLLLIGLFQGHAGWPAMLMGWLSGFIGIIDFLSQKSSDRDDKERLKMFFSSLLIIFILSIMYLPYMLG